MTKIKPYLFEDEDIYSASIADAEFCLNARKLVYLNLSERLDENFCSRLGLVVGFNLYDESLFYSEDTVFIRFFSLLSARDVNHLWALPAGYDFSKDNSRAIEVLDYSPPLIAKIKTDFSEYRKIRGGVVGLYAEMNLLISPCLNYSVLDSNGHYSLIIGPRSFVEEVLGMRIEKSWEKVRVQESIATSLPSLQAARIAYGY